MKKTSAASTRLFYRRTCRDSFFLVTGIIAYSCRDLKWRTTSLTRKTPDAFLSMNDSASVTMRAGGGTMRVEARNMMSFTDCRSTISCPLPRDSP